MGFDVDPMKFALWGGLISGLGQIFGKGLQVGWQSGYKTALTQGAKSVAWEVSGIAVGVGVAVYNGYDPLQGAMYGMMGGSIARAGYGGLQKVVPRLTQTIEGYAQGFLQGSMGYVNRQAFGTAFNIGATGKVVGGAVKAGHQAGVAKASEVISSHSVVSAARTVEQAGISASDAHRIQNAAKKYGVTIHVVGSRAKGTATALSDWDYIVQGGTSRIRGKLKNSLPRGEGGGDLGGLKPSGMDLMQMENPTARGYNPLDIELPHVVFHPV